MTPQQPGAAATVRAPRLLLLTRADCGLCDEMQQELLQLSRQVALPPIVLQDVDDDATLARRHALDLPVLLLDDAGGEPVMVCRHRLDAAELQRLLRPR